MQVVIEVHGYVMNKRISLLHGSHAGGTVYGRRYVQVSYEPGEPGDKREDDLDDGAVEELLFGWFEGRN